MGTTCTLRYGGKNITLLFLFDLDIPTLSIPVPETPHKETSRDDRLREHTLYYDAGFTDAQIALQLNFTLDQVKYALAERITPQKYWTRRKILLNIHLEEKANRLIDTFKGKSTSRVARNHTSFRLGLWNKSCPNCL